MSRAGSLLKSRWTVSRKLFPGRPVLEHFVLGAEDVCPRLSRVLSVHVACTSTVVDADVSNFQPVLVVNNQQVLRISSSVLHFLLLGFEVQSIPESVHERNVGDDVRALLTVGKETREVDR